MRRVLLLGGGHAHVHLLAHAARHPLTASALPGIELVLVSPFERHLYSGMVPGYLWGRYAEAAIGFDLRALAARAGARFVEAPAERIDASAQTVDAGGERLAYDLLSIDIGSEPAGLATPGAREHACTVRPMNRAITLRERAVGLFARVGQPEVAITVVGAGAAGIEVALALERLGRDSGARPAVTIVEAAAGIVPQESTRVRRLALRILSARGIAVRAGQAVAAVEPESVVLEDGTRLRSQLAVWVAGAAPPRLLVDAGLPRDPHGYLLVDATLRATDGSPVFGAGDCIGIEGFPEIAKAGVYAIREAPILANNLRAALAGRALVRYRPQASFLALLNCADGRAIWSWRGFAGRSRFAWWLKDGIDRAFLRRYPEARRSLT